MRNARTLLPSTRPCSSPGQSLIEIIISVGIVVLLVTGLVSGATFAQRMSQLGTLRSRAIKYAQEGIELTRQLRDAGWDPFVNYAQSGGNWCLAEDETWNQASSCTVNIGGIFTRSVLFTWLDPRMNVVVTVKWNDGSITRKSELRTFFTQWKQ